MSAKNQTAIQMLEEGTEQEPLIESYRKLNEKCDEVLIRIAKKKRNKNNPVKVDEQR